MQPPQNPYSGFPNPGDPIPPAGSYNAGGVPPRNPEISFDAISQAWTVLQPSLGVYIGAAAVIAVFSILGQALQYALTPHAPNGQQQFSGAGLAVALLFGLIRVFLSVGLVRMAINHLRTGTPQFSDLVSASDVFLSIVLAYILMGLAASVGCCLCVIPGLLLNGLFMLTIPLIVDKRMGAIEAMGTSFNTLKPQMWMALVFVLVVAILAGAGALACGVGVLITIPLSTIAIAITYRNFFDNGTGPSFGGPTGPVAPIANPLV